MQQAQPEGPPAGMRPEAYDRPGLESFFAPRSVAVIGATETPGTVGRTLYENLRSSGFGGARFPVHRTRSTVLGDAAYPEIGAIGKQVDLAVVVTPAATVAHVISQCGQAGVKAAIVISAGFREVGAVGAHREEEILAAARATNIRLLGPNCLGIMNPVTGLNATFARSMANPGNVGFLSQSGALCTAVLDWSYRERVGFSAFVSVGSMADVGWGDLIDYLGSDPHTRSILIYMESIGDARSFLSAAREAALAKPIIVIKAGRTAAGRSAAASHTGAMTGSDEALDAAFRRCGVLRVDRISDLFYMAQVLSKQPRPRGPRLTIVTNAGGPAVLAADALIREGGVLAELSPDTVARLNQVLPAEWSHHNPVDILGDASHERFEQALASVSKEPESDGTLVVLAPQAVTDSESAARAVIPYARSGKPVLASWMGAESVAAGSALLSEAGIPVFPYPDTAARAFHSMWRYSSNLRALYETPVLPELADAPAPALDRTRGLLDRARRAGRKLLTESESHAVLAGYGLPAMESRVARTMGEAVAAAASIGFPVAVKLHSETITHKARAGGVYLNVESEAAVAAAWEAMETRVGAPGFQGVSVQPMIRREGIELIAGASVDPQLGPVLLFGAGGRLVELLDDHILGLPPLNTTLAKRLIEGTRIYKALAAAQGVDLVALESFLVQFSRLVVEHPEIAEIEINPLLASPDGLLALDARIVLHGPEVDAESLPRPAIRPYPSQYSGDWTSPAGEMLRIRPIRPEDEPAIVDFHGTLSERSVYFRYLAMIKLSQRISHERLTRICFIDYDREMALVAEREGILGVGRLRRLSDRRVAEFAVLVSDSYQGRGLGSELIRRLLAVSAAEGIETVVGEVHGENYGMQHVCRKLGFHLSRDLGDDTVRVTRQVRP